jgi:hypothetical protein
MPGAGARDKPHAPRHRDEGDGFAGACAALEFEPGRLSGIFLLLVS